MHDDDVYRNLPDDLLAALRDPRTVLPGEHALYERVLSWTMAPVLSDPHQPGSAWVEIKTGKSLTGVEQLRAS